MNDPPRGTLLDSRCLIPARLGGLSTLSLHAPETYMRHPLSMEFDVPPRVIKFAHLGDYFEREGLAKADAARLADQSAAGKQISRGPQTSALATY